MGPDTCWKLCRSQKSSASHCPRNNPRRHSGIFRVANFRPGTMPRGKYPESPAPAGSHALISRTPTPGGMLHANLGLPRPPPRNFQPPLPQPPAAQTATATQLNLYRSQAPLRIPPPTPLPPLPPQSPLWKCNTPPITKTKNLPPHPLKYAIISIYSTHKRLSPAMFASAAKEPPPNRPPERSCRLRAASALMFLCAMGAALVFPEGKAGIFPAGGFAPAQAPVDLLQATEDPRFKTPELCLDLGGELQEADGRRVCSGVDANDTFCIVNSADAFPCRGLYKHVIRCNAQYNRPALNPFFCGPACDPQKARGPACERVVPLDDAVAVRRVEYNLAKGFSGAAHTISVGQNHTLSLPENPQYSGFTLNAVGQTDHWEIEITPPLGAATLTASIVADVSCAGCFPASLTIIARRFFPVGIQPRPPSGPLS